MPIDPSIALGVRPVEQPNVLGQMAQAMAMRQAQQEYENEGGLRNALTGGLPEDPSSLLKYGKSGRAVYESALKGRKEQLDSDDKRNTMLGGFAGFLMDNPTPANFESTLTRAVNYKLIPEAKKLELLAQYGGSPEAIKSYATQIFQSAISAQAQQSNTTSQSNARLTSGPGYLQAGIARERLTMEQAEQANIARILRGEPPVPTGAAPAVPMTGGSGGVAPMSSGGVAPVASPTRGTAPVVAPMSGAAPIGNTPMPVATAVQPNVNALNVNPAAPLAAPVTPNVNALTADAIPPEIAQIQTKISQLISSGSPKAIAAADALIKQHNLLMPTRQIVQNTKGEYNAVDQRTSVSTPVLDAAGKQLVGKLPPEQFETSYRKVVGEAKGNRDVGMVTAATAATDNLPKLYETLDQLKTSDAITGFGAEIIKNIEAAKAKFTGDIKAGKKVADTQILDAMLGSDVFPMIQSLGIGARGMDTPAEREYIRGVMTGTINMDKAALIKLTEIRKNIEERAINTYNRNVDNGTLDKFFETEGRTPQKIDVPTYEPKTATPQVGGGVRVTLPDGRSVMLPNAEAAAKFKKDAGIK